MICSDMICNDYTSRIKREGVESDTTKSLRSSVASTITPTVEVESTTVEAGVACPLNIGRVSLFSSALSARYCEDIDLLSFLTTNEYRGIITEIRASTDPTHRRELKQKLPAITPAGVFHHRGSANILTYSGFICVDIDGKDNPNIKDWRATAHYIGSLSPCVLYAGVSAGGSGCFAIYRIATPNRYAEHLASIQSELSHRGIVTDKACKDLARLRFASYDPTPYINREPTPHTLLSGATSTDSNSAKEATSLPQHPQAAQVADQANNCENRASARPNTLPIERVERAVQTLVERGLNIAEAHYDWVRIGFALASTYGEQARPLFHAISAQSSKYKRNECDAQFTHCLRSKGINIGTLLDYLKRVGVRW
ncbi:MAG: PriCT-2 domain-containing protein [Alistipes sp.]|nr:PriCT-2 domain-containing protein [Alistipes sp.]